MTKLPSTTRRQVLAGAGALGLAGSVGMAAPRVWSRTADLKKVRLAWTEVAACHSPLAFGVHKGIFAKHGVDAELYYQGNIGQTLIQALATGKADVGAGLVLDWLKPLEQGFDVKLVTGTHGGCQRILAGAQSGIASVEDLKGRTIAVADITGPAKAAFVVTLAKAGLDPEQDVTWRAFPGDLLAAAIEKGEADALAHLDPDAYRFKKENGLVEVANTVSGVYQDRVCCVIGANGAYLAENKPAVQGVVEAIAEIHDYTADHPDEVAAFYIATYRPKITQTDLTEVLAEMTYHHHPVGEPLIKEIRDSIDDMKLVNVISAQVDSDELARSITANVLV